GYTGAMLALTGSFDVNYLSENLLLTNCLFRNGSIRCLGHIKNCMVRGCDFIFRDGTNGTFPLPRTINYPSPTTTNIFEGDVGFFAAATPSYNLNMIENTYSGNPSITNLSTNYVVDAGHGLVWFQSGGNFFIGRNSITNNGAEATAFPSGPTAVVANDFNTFVSAYAVCALNALRGGTPGASGSEADFTCYFVGNSVVGDR